MLLNERMNKHIPFHTCLFAAVIFTIFFMSCKKDEEEDTPKNPYTYYSGTIVRIYTEPFHIDTTTSMLNVSLKHLSEKVEESDDMVIINFVDTVMNYEWMIKYIFSKGDEKHSEYDLFYDIYNPQPYDLGDMTIYHDPEKLEFYYRYGWKLGGTDYFFSGNKM